MFWKVLVLVLLVILLGIIYLRDYTDDDNDF